MNFNNFDDKINKIIQGCQRAFEKLLAEEKLRDGELVFANEDAMPITVKARDFEAYMKQKSEKKKSK